MDSHLHTRGASTGMLIAAAGEESSTIRALAGCAVGSALCTQLLSELHVHAAASRVDSNALLRGGNADYHTSLI
jgi:hypothetical protein